MNYENLSIKDLFDLLDQKENQIEMIINFINERENNIWKLSEIENIDLETKKEYKTKWIESLLIKNNIETIIKR